MRSRWPDAKIEGTGAKCDLRNEQQREKREESRERREQIEESREGRTTATELTGYVMSRVGDPPHGIEASQDHDDKEKREERREQTDPKRPPEVPK